MKTPYSLYTLDDSGGVFDTSNTFFCKRENRWKILLPERYHSKWNDLKLAWLVFTRKAEAVLRNDL